VKLLRATVVGISLVVLVGCSGSSSKHVDAPTSTSRRVPTSVPAGADPAYARPGPYVVSLTTITAAKRDIDVLYPALAESETGKPYASYDIRAATHDPGSPPLPADPSQLVALPAYSDLPPAAGRFPVVLFSHATGAIPLQNATLEADLAAWGFVVIAPDHTERDALAAVEGRASVNDTRDAQVLIAALNAVAAAPNLGPMLDLSHVAAVGHAQGGATALAALAFPQVETAVAWASIPPTLPVARKPVMLIGAQHDLEFGPVAQRLIYAGLSGAKRLIMLGGGAGNATFSDPCEQLRVSGELIPGGDVSNNDQVLNLAQNGCFPDEIDPELVWPVITHFTVAQLRSVFGIDRGPVGLANAIASAFPNVPLTYIHQP
jgi:predicted dienelactone hydrolase